MKCSKCDVEAVPYTKLCDAHLQGLSDSGHLKVQTLLLRDILAALGKKK